MSVSLSELATKPYRVRKIYRTSAPGCFGWRDSTECFETFSEAEAAMLAPMHNGCYEVQVDVAVNTNDWKKSGKWKLLASRKHSKKAVYKK